MALDADALVDRRRLRRKVVFWRAFAFLLAIAAIGGMLAWSGAFGSLDRRGAHIARLPVGGLIVDDRDRVKLIEELAENERVKAVIVDLNSPGGTTVGGETLYMALRELAEKKPVVAQVGTLAASAGYMTAIASDHIVARHTSITGSIGVYIQYGNFGGLLDTLGVKFDVVRSGPLKAEPNFHSDTPPAVRDNLQALINDSYEWFVARVAERRGLDTDAVRAVAQGGVYSGEAARDLGLIDDLGGEEASLKWLETERGIAADLPVVTWRVAREREGGLPFVGRMAHWFGSGVASGALEAVAGAGAIIPEGLALDGLVSVWHARNAAESLDRTGGRE
ncbi:signal peptide peptidase SppA [Stappia sp. WLB 29]|uniref:signal peptide peptidase SppA n=1 Tax=Stappia sp. WLB 29 TaxID=2925220 RepID=UPI0020BD6B2C|nr:signal peptide peptidase SppA [Stappia sp. WLB 29]